MTPMKPVEVQTQKSQASTDQQVEEFRAAQVKKAREATERDMEQRKTRAAESAKAQNQTSSVVRLSQEGVAASKQHAQQNNHPGKR